MLIPGKAELFFLEKFLIPPIPHLVENFILVVVMYRSGVELKFPTGKRFLLGIGVCVIFPIIYNFKVLIRKIKRRD